MSKRIFCLCCAMALLLTACASPAAEHRGAGRGGDQPLPPPVKEPVVEEPAAEEPEEAPAEIPLEELEILDYAKVLNLSDQYDGKTITVVGRVEEFEDIYDRREFFFAERSSHEVYVNLSEELYQNTDRTCAVGDLVVVQGIWQTRPKSFSKGHSLQNARILARNDTFAETHYRELESQWLEKYEKFAQSTPLIDYMQIVENLDNYTGSRVRIAGQFKYIDSFSDLVFLNRKTNEAAVEIDTEAMPRLMKVKCVENRYVIISGTVKKTDYPAPCKIQNCYIEVLDEEAEAVALELDTQWKEQYAAERADYISQCSLYSYNELARYPDKYRGVPVEVTGTVINTDIEWGDYYVLLDTGGGNLLYVNYTGLCYQEPDILVGDYITFWGEGYIKKTYTDPQGVDFDIPSIIAPYSNILEIAG